MKNMQQPNPAFTLDRVASRYRRHRNPGSLLAARPGPRQAQSTAPRLQQQPQTGRPRFPNLGDSPQRQYADDGAYAMGGDSDDVGYRMLAASQRSWAIDWEQRRLDDVPVHVQRIEHAEDPVTARRNMRARCARRRPPSRGTMWACQRVPYTNDLNVSYFIGVDAQETYPRMFLTGDHNLGGNGNPPTAAYWQLRALGRLSFGLAPISRLISGACFLEQSALRSRVMSGWLMAAWSGLTAPSCKTRCRIRVTRAAQRHSAWVPAPLRGWAATASSSPNPNSLA